MYTVQVTNISTGEIIIQDPYPSDGRLVMPVAAGDTESADMVDSQYDRIYPQLEWHRIEGNITYTSMNGPASKVENDSGVPGVSVADALDNLAGGLASDMFLSAGRSGATVSNVYLRGPGEVPMNEAGYVIPFDAKITSISLSSTGAESWTLEIRKNNAPAVIASLVVAAAERAYDDTLDVDIAAGDELQFYCNGIDIGSPSGAIVLRRR